MQILVDTCTLVWLLKGSHKLSKKARAIVENKENILYVSVISIWEIFLLLEVNKLSIDGDIENTIKVINSKYKIQILDLPVMIVFGLKKLPRIHKDPFDRMLICQAMHLHLSILTPDQNIKRYDVKTIW